LLAPFPFVVVKGELFVVSGFLVDVRLDGEATELVSAASMLVVSVVVLETESDAVTEEDSRVVCVDVNFEVIVEGLPETVVVLPTVIG